MTPNPQLFRGLILISLGCLIANLGITFLVPSLIPEPLRLADENYMQSAAESGSALYDLLQLLIIAGLLVASISAFIGMFLFKPWARPLNVILAFSSFIIWPLLGYNLASGWSQAISDFALIILGGVIAMSYFSPISNHFDKKDD